MPRKTPTDKLLVLTKSLIELFSMPFHAVGDTALTGDAGDPRAAECFLDSYPGDPIGAETFANHYYPEDFIKELRLQPRAKRRFLMTLAEALVKVWVSHGGRGRTTSTTALATSQQSAARALPTMPSRGSWRPRCRPT